MGGRVGWAAAFALAAVVCAAACSLGDFSSFSGGPDDAGGDAPGDGSGGGDGATTDDGATGGDGSANGDGATTDDGASAGDGAAGDGALDAGPFCPRAGAFFCDDFDDDAASLTPPWDFVYAPGAAVLDFTTARFVSPGRAIYSQTSGGDNAAIVKKTFTADKVRIAFDTYIEKRGGNCHIATFTTGPANVAVAPLADDKSTIAEAYTLADGGTEYASTQAEPIPVGAWTHVDFAIDTPNRTATLTIGNSMPVTRHLDAPWTNLGGEAFTIGLPSATVSTVYYDNVEIYVQ